MLLRSELCAIREERDACLAHAAEQQLLGHDDYADASADAADRLTCKIEGHYAEREATLYELLDKSELTDDALCQSGGVVSHCRGIRIIGVSRDQAVEQYRRIRGFLADFGITAEIVEWSARDVAYAMLGFPATERVRT